MAASDTFPTPGQPERLLRRVMWSRTHKYATLAHLYDPKEGEVGWGFRATLCGRKFDTEGVRVIREPFDGPECFEFVPVCKKCGRLA